MVLTICYRVPRYLLAGSLFLLLASCSDSTTTEVTGADPGVLEAPIAYVRRPIALDNNGNARQQDLREPLFFVEGGDVFIRSNSTVTAREINITAGITQGQGDVKDLQSSFDGTRLIFSLRLFDPNPNDDDTPSWNIYQYDLAEQTLSCILDADPATPVCDGLNAEQGDDIAPAYLPDGRIVFSSNRQRLSGEMLTNEGRPRFRALDEDEDTMAMVLHVMNADGSDLTQISFNQSHDLNPQVLTHSYPGEIMFTRWDHAGANNAMHLYKINPDGTDLQLLYGAHSHNTGANRAGSNTSTIQFSRPQEMQDGRLMVIARPFSNTFGGGDIVIIDVENYVNNDQPVTFMAGIPGRAQSSATINNISATDEVSLGGRYSAAYPLWDDSNRILVSRSSCELELNNVRRPCIEPYLSSPNAEEAAPAYSLWLYDMSNNSEKVIVPAQRGMVLSDIVALQSRPLPLDKVDHTLDTGWQSLGLGAIHIRSVYDFGNGSFDGCFLSDCTDATAIATVNDLGDPVKATADQRPARFVRFEKAVSMADPDDPDLGDDAPDLDRAAFGPIRNLGMREIIGYAPVEPDGSVKVKVPASIPLAISVLDKSGRRIGARHANWFQVKAGDTMECTGCHSHASANTVTPPIHQRRDAEVASINSGIPSSGIFVNTLIPGQIDAYFGDIGESMAEVRFKRASVEPQLSADIIYSDVWTDSSVRTPDTDFSYRYTNLTTPSPASSSCLPDTSWDFKCRIVINYEQHIHPLWSVNRGANSCISCHTNADPVLLIDRVADAQLDLTNGDSDQEAERFKSYRELFFTDQGEALDATGLLVDIQIPQDIPILDANGDPVLDINGNPTFNTILVDDPAARVTPSMSANGARASFFIQKMSSANATRNGSAAPGDSNYLDHSTFLSMDELRLISEWLDIGAQYFNNPFDPDVPSN